MASCYEMGLNWAWENMSTFNQTDEVLAFNQID